ncbi:putative MFS transporter, AGZA family, xanthine/uracil permease [Saccharicrinis carchari]|uniref:Putative MFS transporter, AGZA family, xanthine/uracil permease n=1 Tax=Saccharicrinis carchari TaxID=1168039 RepID=A0A521ADK7_SACCC|nr:NCS2 family permease [Saccharicrinis carchari]SMO32780.1 putative MFS transporter, AGZA family, xanthine/uracil permease [Saccharicrinis carchari]
MLEKFFQLKKNNTNVRTEIIAGITTFMTMAYILAVNPAILSVTGMDQGAIFTATALSAAVATMVMALIAKLPFALAPGMGLNAFFAFTVVLGMGHTWQFALTAVFIEGIIFILLTAFNIRELIIKAIPMNIKHAISVGIGLFIALIGFKNAGVVIDNQATLVGLGKVIDINANAAPLVALITLVITGALLARKVKGALLIGIFVGTVLGIPFGLTSLPTSFDITPPSLSPIFAKFEWSNIFTLDMVLVLLTFLFVDLFDTVGTLIGVTSKANMFDKNGQIPRVKKALFADSIGTTVGAVLGTSTVTTYVESASGVGEGGRTGLTAATTGVLFLMALFVSPLFLMIPSAATAPTLILVGVMMFTTITKIDLKDFTESIPAFLTIVMMPFTFSIAEGIVFGMLAFVILKALTGKYKEISIISYLLAILFLLKFFID